MIERAIIFLAVLFGLWVAWNVWAGSFLALRLGYGD
jgi:hypothetical protein